LFDHLYESIEKPEVKIIDVFVCKLRKKLAEATGEPRFGAQCGRLSLRRVFSAPNRPS
jgi:DNA-binding response OmpR family regulator